MILAVVCVSHFHSTIFCGNYFLILNNEQKCSKPALLPQTYKPMNAS